MIELRSDTFTMPTDAMRRAMTTAKIGDDVYGEDPTVRDLEELAAELTGKQAACLMPSGTMANLCAQMAHAPRGSRVLVGRESHIYLYEAGGASVCGGLMYEPLPNTADGRVLPIDLQAGFADDPDDPHIAPVALICLENTQNRCGGAVLPVEYGCAVGDVAHRHGVPVHLDGARLFNAAVAVRQPVSAFAAAADSVQFCLSKGLGAPIGSVLAGDAEFVVRARRIRKMLGGGMRQAGVVAAAGLMALDDGNVERLSVDHENASRLAHGLAEIDGIEIDPAEVRTNIVMFEVTDPRFSWQEFIRAASHRGLALAELGHGRVRAVTHNGVSRADIDAAVEIVAKVLVEGPADAGGSSSAGQRGST